MASLWGEDDDDNEEDLLDMGDNEDENISPAATTKTAQEQLLMRFCPHDSSMLYPQVRFADSDFRSLCFFLTLFINIGKQTLQNITIRLSSMSIHRSRSRSTPRI